MTLSALLVRGPYKGPSGYDHHVREFVRALDRQGVAIQLVDIPEWGPTKLPASHQDSWFESLQQSVEARVALHFCMPHQVVEYPGRANVNYTMFEATRIPPLWVERNRQHDLVIVPTESSRRAWVESGLPDSLIRTCPLGINPVLFSNLPNPLPLTLASGESISSFRVRFLNVSEIGPRKNLIGLIRTWLCATSRHDDAVLLLKLGRYAPGWWELLQWQIEQLQSQLQRRLTDAAPIHIISDIFADADMPRLYGSATHYISLSFGEGWDQTMVEAAASGLRLIAPEHSAYTSYLDSSIARLIPSHEVPADFPDSSGLRYLFEGAQWWEPDQEAAADAIRTAIAGRDTVAASARERVLTHLTWDQAARCLSAILSETEVTEGGRRRPRWPRWNRRSARV